MLDSRNLYMNMMLTLVLSHKDFNG